MRDAANTLMASCSAPPRSGASRGTVPVQAAALLTLWDGSPCGLSPSQCREHAAQVRFVGHVTVTEALCRARLWISAYVMSPQQLHKHCRGFAGP